MSARTSASQTAARPPATTNSPPGRLESWLRGPIPVVALLVCHVALGISAVSRKSLTFDETAHITGGLSYWARNDYRLHAENGNWSQRWAALPLWLGGYELPRVSRGWQIGDVWTTAPEFMFGGNYDVDALLMRSRWMMAVPAVLLGWLVYAWSRQLFGAYGGLVSLTLYAFSPTMLANSFLTTSDLFVTLFFSAALWSLWTLLHRVTPWTVALLGLALGGLFLAKFSAVLILPMALLLVVLRLLNPRPLVVEFGQRREIAGVGRQLAVFAGLAVCETLLVIVLIWGTFGFRYTAFVPAGDEPGKFYMPWEAILTHTPAWLIRAVEFGRSYHLLPEGYLYGFAYTLHFSQHRVTFLHGAFSQTGWTSFFPICLALKTPLELFVLLGLGGWGAWLFRPRGGNQNGSATAGWWTGLYDFAPLAVLLGVYWWFALRSNLNIGHRHLLPTYPAMFILAGAAAKWFQPAPRGAGPVATEKSRGKPTVPPEVATRLVLLGRALVGTALVLGALEACFIWPHYLAYFNVLAGGPRHGYRWLVDSSLDWGQDLRELKQWLDRHPEDTRDPQRVYFSYFGSLPAEYYDIRAERLPNFFLNWQPHIPKPLTGGLYCLSASMLNSVYTDAGEGRWNKKYEQEYQELTRAVQLYWQPAPNPEVRQQLEEAAATTDVQSLFSAFEQLRLSRLTSFLRQREPDDMVGYSILLYRLTDEEVAQALYGPPCELLPQPEK